MKETRASQFRKMQKHVEKRKYNNKEYRIGKKKSSLSKLNVMKQERKVESL